jgi:dipeptidase D
MVCEKEHDCDIDFEKDGLSLIVDGDDIHADRTTLGGDDGIAVAFALAILDSTDIPHPPIEAVFTVDEEIGMLGAASLDCSPLKSRIMLNLDSEDEGSLLVSCAGGVSTTAHLPLTFEKTNGLTAEITISGLVGGHSGTEINKDKANSNRLMGRTLYALSKKYDFSLVSVNGGLKDNAIPNKTTAVLMLTDDGVKDAFASSVSEMNDTYKHEYAVTDPSLSATVSFSNNTSADAMTKQSTKAFITALVNLPGGVHRMSHDIDGLVQTSLNMGILKTTENEMQASFSIRSSVSSEKFMLMDMISCLMDSLGGYITNFGEYPAWEFKKESHLRDLMSEVFEEQYGYKPIINALHAGVECGLFSEKLPGLDCVSFGPAIYDIHTAKERLSIESVIRTWKFTLEVLKRLK